MLKKIYFSSLFLGLLHAANAQPHVVVVADYAQSALLAETMVQGLELRQNDIPTVQVHTEDYARNLNRLKKIIEDTEQNPEAVALFFIGPAEDWVEVETKLLPQTLPVVPLWPYGVYIEQDGRARATFGLGFSQRLRALLGNPLFNARCPSVNYILRDTSAALFYAYDIMNVLSKESSIPFKILWDSDSKTMPYGTKDLAGSCVALLSGPQEEREIANHILSELNPPPPIFSLWGGMATQHTQPPASLRFKGLPFYYLETCAAQKEKVTRHPDLYAAGKAWGVRLYNQLAQLQQQNMDVFEQRKSLKKALQQNNSLTEEPVFCLTSYDANEF